MENFHKRIPTDYPLCMHTDCPKADTCLHQQAFLHHEKMGKFLRIINPSQCARLDDCPHYANNQPVKFAKGFTNFQKQMYPAQYAKFMTTLICHFGRNAYFKRRRGETLIPPAEQAIIRSVLKKSGANHQMDFDAYVEDINWMS